MKILPILKQIVEAQINEGNYSELRLTLPYTLLDILAEEADKTCVSTHKRINARHEQPRIEYIFFGIGGVVVFVENGPLDDAFKNINI